MKVYIKALVAFMCFWTSAQVSLAQDYTNPKYLEGAVTEVNGMVTFTQHYNCEGRSRETIYNALETFTKALLKSKVALTQCRLTQITPEEGVLAASMEETLTFKSTKWQLDTARFFFQIIFEVKDGGFDVTLRRIRYIYDPMNTYDVNTTLNAEDWIVDKEALNKKGQLTKIGGKKFRRATIDRKDEIFQAAYDAVMK